VDVAYDAWGEVAVLADNNAALAGLVTVSIVVPLAILAIVIWFFRKSAKRFDAEQEQARSQRSDAPRRC
jgi:membrane protein implicated in regulation of membrane protease activity